MAELAGWWLHVECGCGAGRTVHMPFRLLAAELGWQVRLGEVLPRLKCTQCQRPPRLVALLESAQGGRGRYGQGEPRRLVLIDRREDGAP